MPKKRVDFTPSRPWTEGLRYCYKSGGDTIVVDFTSPPARRSVHLIDGPMVPLVEPSQETIDRCALLDPSTGLLRKV